MAEASVSVCLILATTLSVKSQVSQSQFVNRKQRIVHGEGASKINCSAIVFIVFVVIQRHS